MKSIRILLLTVLLSMGAVFALNGDVHAQLFPKLGTSNSEDAKTSPDDKGLANEQALQQMIDAAKTAGSRIIIIDPVAEAAPEEHEMTMASIFSSENLLRARNRFVFMFNHTIEIYQSLPAILAGMHPDRDLWWIVRAIAIGISGLIAGHLMFRMITGWGKDHLRETFYRENEKRLAGKLGFILFRAAWMTMGIAVGFGTAILIAVIFDVDHEQSRTIIFDMVSTYAVYRILRGVVFWNFFMPDTPSHRLVNLSDDRAKSLFRDWARILTASSFIVFFCRLVEDLEVSNDVFRITFIIGMLFIAIMLISLTLLHRQDTKSLVLGPDKYGNATGIRKMVARIATPIMLLYIVSAWVASSLRLVLGSPGGFLLLAAPIIVFVVAIFVYGLAIFILELFYQNRELKFYRSRRDRSLREMREWKNNQSTLALASRLEDDRDDDLRDGEVMKVHEDDRPNNPHRKYLPVFKPFFAGFIQATVITVSIGELSRLWGVDIGREGGHPLAAFLDTVLVLVVALGAYKAFNQYIDFKIVEEGGTLESDTGKPGETDGEGGKGESRLATLLPIFRNVLVSLIVAISFVVVLSNLGVNVGPLFAGAGVVGIAIGFGAQTLIRDIFSGTFFLIDDAFRKGEYVEIDQIRGIVEKISMRSFQLRHHLGAVHTIPFGEITRITNYSRDWVMMKLPLRLPYDTDVERVRKLIKKLGQELLEDEAIGDLFLQPLKSQGVYKMEDSAMIVRVKYMTRPGDQFITRKAIYAAIRELFEREGIKFAHREVTVRMADDQKGRRLTAAQKKAVTGAVRNVIEDEVPVDGKGSQAASKFDDM